MIRRRSGAGAWLLALAPLAARAHGEQPQVTDLVLPAPHPTEVWALTDNQGVFAVGPGERRWLCEDAVEPGAGMRAVAVVTAERWILSTESGLWITEDGGCSFAPLGGPLVGHRARWLSAHGDEVLIATDTLGRPNDVFLSVDAGRTFAPVGLGLEGQVTSALRASADPRRIYLVYEQGTLRSHDGGRSFEPFKPGPPELEAAPLELTLLSTSPVDADVVFAAIERFDTLVVRSEDAGGGWVQVAQVPDFPIQLVLDARGGRALINGLFVGFLRSEDGGRTFAPAPRAVDRLSGLVRAGGRLWGTSQVFFGGPFVVGHSDDFGATWQPDLGHFTDARRQPCPAATAGRDCCQHLCPGVPAGGACGDQAPMAGPTCGGSGSDGGVDAGAADGGRADGGLGDGGRVDAAGPDAARADAAPVPPDAGVTGDGAVASDAADARPPAPADGAPTPPPASDGCSAAPGR